ncbi:restriction endonuclease subunit S, partial [uncultured Chloroflexus sp.]|uniref:restriction endonuclease subunit S n=1 Tax=uncultured Chloroflexus sp. TaxID=214040 RepID=UPI0026067221
YRHLLEARFLFYLMLSHGFISIVDSMTYGAKMLRANPNQIGNLGMSLPSLPEQRAIAEYLDRETACIDALIAHKRDLLALLERQRAALISHAVTQGLNPAAPRKDSGIPWLGEIPAHWDVRRLKFVASINPDTLPETTPKDYTFAYIDIGNVSSDGNVSDLQEYTFEAAPTRARRKVSTGDTIISTVRTYLQAIAYIEDNLSNCIVSTGFAVLRPRESVHSRFLYYLVRSQGFVDAVMAHSNGVSYPAINPTTLAGLWGLLPPLPEQRAIAEYLDRETARIDRLKGEIEASIDLLGRYRAALISAAVTGKIDVRGALSW